jgi:hypothetical protein
MVERAPGSLANVTPPGIELSIRRSDPQFRSASFR